MLVGVVEQGKEREFEEPPSGPIFWSRGSLFANTTRVWLRRFYVSFTADALALPPRPMASCGLSVSGLWGFVLVVIAI